MHTRVVQHSMVRAIGTRELSFMLGEPTGDFIPQPTPGTGPFDVLPMPTPSTVERPMQTMMRDVVDRRAEERAKALIKSEIEGMRNDGLRLGPVYWIVALAALEVFIVWRFAIWNL